MVQVIKVPLDAGNLGKNKGTASAPDEVCKKAGESFLGENGKVPVFSFDTIPADNDNLEQAHEDIFEKSLKVFDSMSSSKPVCFIGGDHSITYSTMKAFVLSMQKRSMTHAMSAKSDQHISDLSLTPIDAKKANCGMVIIDAHPDMMQKFDPPTHENYLRCLIEDGIVDPSRIVLIGVRVMDKEELAFIARHKIKVFTMKEIAEEGFKESVFSIMSCCREWENVYVSIDIDGVDPAFAPGTGYCEPGGISSRDLLLLVQKLRLLSCVRCFDIVEINPKKDIGGLTVSLGAKILVEICS